MTKRIVCFLLAMIMIMGMLPVAAITANAASEWTTSDKAINVLKQFEGFSKNPYQDAQGYWYIGYGSQIGSASEYPNGITAADALALLKTELKDVDKAINAFTKSNNLTLKSYEHDALALFTYSYGTAWLNGNGPFRQAVLQGKTGNAFINAIAQSHGGVPGGDNFKGLMNRRLAEANMYLNNNYAYYCPSNYTYVIMEKDGNGVADAADTVIAYDSNSPISLTESYNPTAPAGHTFLGWYLDGSPVAALNSNTAGKTLVAKYAAESGEVAASYKLNTSSFASLNVYHLAYAESEIKDKTPKGTLKANTEFTVVSEKKIGNIKWVKGDGVDAKGNALHGWVYIGKIAEDGNAQAAVVATATAKQAITVYEGATADSNSLNVQVAKGQTVNVYEIKVEKTETGNKSWGKVSVNGVSGWINLAYATVNTISNENNSADGRTGKIINNDYVNVRAGADVSSAKLTTLARGTEVTIIETTMNGAAQWGRVKWSGLKDGYQEGWVYMYYVQVSGLEHSNPDGSTGASDVVQYTGVVTSNINLNVRADADVYAAKVDSLATGTKVNVYEVATSRGMKWGRIGDGQWVCLSYVKLTAVDNSGSTSNGTVAVTSTQGVVNTTSLDVLKNYNSNAAKVGTLQKGAVVTILEKNTEKTETGTRIWGRISENGVEGWINLAYVDLKTVTSVSGSTSGSTSGGTTTTVTETPAVISNCLSVNVRESAGVYSKAITKLANGTNVTVYEQITYSDAPWARIKWDNGTKEGWVCMYYVTLNASNASTNTSGTVSGTNSTTISATGFVNNHYLNVRSGAGLGYAQMGTLAQGAKVTVYEQIVADGLIWGRILYNNAPGYVCMSYITVESASTTGKGVMGTVARCFAKANVRSAPGTNNALVATVNVGSRVEVFETRTYSNQLWGRIAQGWICMDYVLLDSELPEGTILDATQPTTEATQAATNATEETINRDGEIGFIIEAKIQKDLDVYNDTSDKSDRVGTINAGNYVDIKAIKNNGAELWGRIDQYATAGWILMSNTNVSYAFTRYVAVDDQPVYVDASTSSAVKGSLPINTWLNIDKVTTDGTSVYGWVENDANGNGIYGWIPMDKTTEKETEIIKVYKSGETVGNSQTAIITGTTFSAMDAYDSIGGTRVLFKMNSGVNVKIDKARFENGRVWGHVTYQAPGANSGEYGYAYVDMSKINYTVDGKVVNVTDGTTKTVDVNGVITEVTELNVRSTMDNSSTANIITTLAMNTDVKVCQLAFDAYGNVWARLNGNYGYDANTNGAFVMIMTAGQVVNVQTNITPAP